MMLHPNLDAGVQAEAAMILAANLAPAAPVELRLLDGISKGDRR